MDLSLRGVPTIGITGEVHRLLGCDDDTAEAGFILGGAQNRTNQKENRKSTHFVAHNSRSKSSMESTTRSLELLRGCSKMTLLFVFVVCVASVFAQSTNTATLSGVVTDPTQAVVADAKITITRVETGIKREARTGADGEYRAVLLPPGQYDVSVEKPGFLAQTKKGLELTVGQRAAISFQLAIGASSLIVEISTQVPLLESERSQQANTLDATAIRNLPINRRDYLSF